MPGVARRYVYILRSERDPERHYVGLTTDVRARLDWHNNGPSGCTLHHRPWRLLVALEFADERSAARFERYLKSALVAHLRSVTSIQMAKSERESRGRTNRSMPHAAGS
jgi:predicted GIY-YIG superfamily endonuclease